MKTVGIIGGLGPETTAEFYLQTVFSCFEKERLHRPPILLWSVPLPFEIEEDLIQRSRGEERYIPFLIEAAQRLESGGADFLVMPCNSVHIFIDHVRRSVGIPVLSIVEETVAFLRQGNIDSVAMLATDITIKRDLYKREFDKHGIQQILPTREEQEAIGRVINKLVRSRHDERDAQEILQIIASLRQRGVHTILLACTDLQLLIPHDQHMKIFDTMNILVEATVRDILQ